VDYFTPSLVLAFLLFAIGAGGALCRRNAISLLMCIELMLNAANLAIIALATRAGAEAMANASLIVLFVITVAAAEAAVGLAIFIRLHTDNNHLDVDRMEVLRG
jgi:NADH-quinone oxidoreductase subunit K